MLPVVSASNSCCCPITVASNSRNPFSAIAGTNSGNSSQRWRTNHFCIVYFALQGAAVRKSKGRTLGRRFGEEPQAQLSPLPQGAEKAACGFSRSPLGERLFSLLEARKIARKSGLHLYLILEGYLKLPLRARTQEE
jgi:hypothetical protein